MEQMVSVYASCKTYMDTGEVQILFLEKRGRRTVIRPFSTSFVRPADFRFEFQNRRGEREWDIYIVWRHDDSVKTWWSVKPGVMTDRPFPLALAGATGVSGGSAHTIPQLLMPDLISGGRIR